MKQSVTVQTLGLVIACLAPLGGCKSEEDRQGEQVAKDLAQAQREAAKAQAELAKAQAAAQQNMAKTVQELSKSGEALAAQGMAAGAQAAAAGAQAAAAAMNGMANVLGQAGAGTASLVDFRALKELLPESIDGFKRTSATGEKSGVMGMGVSQAMGKYQGEGQARMRIKLIDTAGVGGLAAAGMALAGLEVDKETEDGYERTSTVGGRKMFEKYNSRSKRGEVKALVGGRFIVEVDADEVAMETVKNLVSTKLDLAKLEALATPK